MLTVKKKNYFYGPVPSRRLGVSLGVDIIPRKTCSFDCVYCQLGPGSKRCIKRSSYIDIPVFKKELRDCVRKNPALDHITISGSGEPTLHTDLDKIISIIKKTTHRKYPVCVITNSSLLYRKKVRDELQGADLIIPSLDAARASVFRAVNKPHASITVDKVIRVFPDQEAE